MGNARLGHIRIEKIELRGIKALIHGSGWRWRTRYIRNGQIGVWSERYETEGDCDRSIHAHRAYMAAAPESTIEG